MMRILAKRVPVWLSAIIITIMLTAVIYPWTSGTDTTIEIMSISAADEIYLPHTLQGVCWTDVVPLYQLKVQYALYDAGYGTWADLETVRLEGWDIRDKGALTSREALNSDIMAVGLSYAVRIYAVDYDSTAWPDPADMSEFEANDAVVVFTVKEGVVPR
jgi:hypothetical protein